MNLSQLYYFRRLAELEHYGQTAKELGISQSTLWHAITTLEDDLGTHLFVRSGRNIHLSNTGRLFKKYVDRSLAILDEGRLLVEKCAGQMSGTIHLGAVPSVHVDFLPQALLKYRELRGDLVDLHLEVGSTPELIRALEEGVYDIAITSDVKRDGFIFDKLLSLRLVVLVGEDHPLAHRSTLHAADLAPYRICTYNDGVPAGSEVNEFLRGCGLNPSTLNMNRDADNEFVLAGLVSISDMVGLSLDAPGLASYRNLQVIPLDEDNATNVHDLGLMRLADHAIRPAAQDFSDFLIEFSQGRTFFGE